MGGTDLGSGLAKRREQPEITRGENMSGAVLATPDGSRNRRIYGEEVRGEALRSIRATTKEEAVGRDEVAADEFWRMNCTRSATSVSSEVRELCIEIRRASVIGTLWCGGHLR